MSAPSARPAFWLVLSLLALAAAPGCVARRATAERVLDRYVEVTGGRAAYEAVRSRFSTGRMEIVGQGIAGEVSLWQALPDRMYLAADIPGLGLMEYGSDGETVWERSPMMGPRIIDGAEGKALLRSVALDDEALWREHYRAVALAGEEAIDGHPCWKIVLTPVEGAPVTSWFDQETGLLLKTSTVMETQMGNVPSEIWLEDYRDVDGLLVPYTSRQRALGLEQLIRADRIEHGVAIPEGRFDLPEEIRALKRARENVESENGQPPAPGRLP